MARWKLKSTVSSDDLTSEIWSYGRIHVQNDGHHVSASRRDQRELTEKDEKRVVLQFGLEAYERVPGGMISTVGGEKLPPIVHWIDFDNVPTTIPAVYEKYLDLAKEALKKAKDDDR